MTCKHKQYIKIKDVVKYQSSTGRVELEGARIGCVDCGRIIDIWENGKVNLIVPGTKQN